MSEIPGQKPRLGRDYRLDNAKFILIVLVVIGHVAPPWTPQDVFLDSLCYWIYLFHMPAFVFISGYFTKHPTVDDRRSHGVLRLVVVYLLFEAFYEQFRALVQTGGPAPPVLLTPEGMMWFLIALALWRMMAPHLLRLRHPVIVSVAVSLLVGAVARGVDELALGNVLGMLPFFVFGMRASPERLRWLERRWARPAGVGVLAGSAVLVETFLHRRLPLGWLYWNHSYGSLGVSVPRGIAIRAALLALVVLLVAAVLAVVPRRRTWMSGLGQASLYGYLLHGLVVWPFGWLRWGTPRDLGPGRVFLFTGCLVVTAALCSPVARRLARPVVEPRLGWVVRPVSRPPHPGSVRPR